MSESMDFKEFEAQFAEIDPYILGADWRAVSLRELFDSYAAALPGKFLTTRKEFDDHDVRTSEKIRSAYVGTDDTIYFELENNRQLSFEGSEELIFGITDINEPWFGTPDDPSVIIGITKEPVSTTL